MVNALQCLIVLVLSCCLNNQTVLLICAPFRTPLAWRGQGEETRLAATGSKWVAPGIQVPRLNALVCCFPKTLVVFIWAPAIELRPCLLGGAPAGPPEHAQAEPVVPALQPSLGPGAPSPPAPSALSLCLE